MSWTVSDKPPSAVMWDFPPRVLKDYEEEQKVRKLLNEFWFQTYKVGQMAHLVFGNIYVPSKVYIGPASSECRWTVTEMRNIAEYMRQAEENKKHSEILKLLGEIAAAMKPLSEIALGIKHLVHQRDREDVQNFAIGVLRPHDDKKENNA